MHKHSYGVVRVGSAQDDDVLCLVVLMQWFVRPTTKKNAKSIADAKAKIEDSTYKIEELIGSSARLSTGIANLENEVAENRNEVCVARTNGFWMTSIDCWYQHMC